MATDITEFHKAVKDRKINTIKEAIVSNRDLLFKQNLHYNEIALHLACKYKNCTEEMEIVKELLRHDPPAAVPGHCGQAELATQSHEQLTIKNVAGNTPLHVAANFGKVEIVKELLKYEAEGQTLLKEQNIFKNTPVHTAASKGHVGVLEAMHEKDSTCIKLEGRFEATPLSSACGYGKLAVVEWLLKLPNADELLNVSSIPIKLPAFSKASEPREWDAKKLNRIDRTKKYSSGFSRKHQDYTPLTRACQFGHLKVVECLLAKEAKRNSLALIKAIEGSYNEIVEKLLFAADGTIQMNLLQIAYKPDNSDSVLTTPFGELIKHMPDVAEKVLHKCVTLERFLVNARNFKVEVDYKLVDQNFWRKDKQNHKFHYYTRGEEQEGGPIRFNKSTHPLSLMVQYKRVELLTHPVVASLMHDKWKSMYGILSFIYWLSYIILYLGLTNYLLLMLRNPSSCKQANMGNTSSADMGSASGAGPNNGSCDFDDGHGIDDDRCSAIARTLAYFMLFYSAGMRLIFESFGQVLFSIYVVCLSLLDHQRHNKKGLCPMIFRAIEGIINYFWEIVNWLRKVTLFLLSTIIAAMVIKEGSCLPGWAWQIGAVVMWLSWIELIYISMQFQFIGIYALMFTTVSKTLLKLVPLALMLVIAFGLTFHFLIHQPQLTVSPYHTGGFSLLKALSMTTGDIDTNTFFKFNCHGQDTTRLEYLELSTFFWIMSLLLMTVLFSNLLIGLAVGDIKSIHKEASFKKLALQVDYILTIENQMLPCLKRRFGNEDKKEFTPNELSKWYHKILDEFIYITWGGTRYDSQESMQRLITYYYEKQKEE